MDTSSHDTTIPTSLSDRLELAPDLRVPMTWDAFLDLLPHTEYRIEYTGGEMCSIMGFATESHELLVLEIADILRQILGKESYRYFASNLALHVPSGEKQYYNADCVVIKGPSERVLLKGTMYSIANPLILVEVLSATTFNYDLGQKFHAYREIPSLQQVLFIDSTSQSIISQTRELDGTSWLLREFTDDENQVPVLDQGHFQVKELYAKVDW